MSSSVEVISPLQCGFSFWYMRRSKGGSSAAGPSEASTESVNAADVNTSSSSTSAHPYENAVKQIATVQSVEDFWSVYDHMVRPGKVAHNVTTTFHFFREGIKPTWEDPHNARGGQWTVRLRKGLASRYWEELLLALIGAQFTSVPDGEVCGAVISVRYTEDILSVWNKTSSDPEVTERVRDNIKRILQLPNFVHMEYKPHETSMMFGDKANAAPGMTSAVNTHTYRSGTTTHHHAGKSGATSHGHATGEREGSSTYSRPATKRDSERGSWR